MQDYIVKFELASPILFNRNYEHDDDPEVEKREGEEKDKDAYERRTWRHRAHLDTNKEAIIPAIWFRNMLREAAPYRNDKVPGSRGGATYTKHFDAGILVLEPVRTGVKVENLERVAMFVPADGKHGSGRRVWKFFPQVSKLTASFRVTVLDETISQEVLERHVYTGGNFIGIGSRRPRRGGEFGRLRIGIALPGIEPGFSD